MTFRRLATSLLVLLAAGPALADGGVDETPDASVGMGGADMNTEEGDENRPNGICSLSRDCERGFACVNGRCRYVGFRPAEAGCSAAPGLMLLGAALVTLAARRRRRATASPTRRG